MKAASLVFCLASFLGRVAFGQELHQVKSAAETVAVSSVVAYQTALARADVAVAKSLLNESLLKGEVGEAIRDQTVGRYLHRSGQWLNVSPRLGPQGLDHVSVQNNESGKPHRLMVDESKFGSTTQLPTTKSGDLQMGEKWIGKHLRGLAGRYDKVAATAQQGIPSAKVPKGLSSKQFIRIPLNDSESVVFWRSDGTWHYDGPPESRAKATALLKSRAELFRAGADGRIDFPKRIFQSRIDGDVLKVNILDAALVDAVGGKLNKLPVKASLEFPLPRSVWASDAIGAKFAEEIRRQMPHLNADEAKRLAQGIQTTAKTAQEALSRTSFTRFVMADASKAGTKGVVVAVPLEIAAQLLNGDTVNWSRVAGVGGLAGASAVAGSTIGNATTYALVRTELGYSASVATAEILGLRSASRFANVAGGVTGGGATAILFAYGGYCLGYYDIQTANRSAMAGVAGAGAGAAASAVTLGLISTYATAGTGVAISTLSGASATSASLAWVGGGTVASGGFGVTGGTVILGTGVGIVFVGVTAAVIYGFQLADEHQETVRLAKTMEYLSGKQTFFVPDTQPGF